MGPGFTGFVGGYPGMGTSPMGAFPYGNSYGGFGQTFMGPPVGGAILAPGAAQAQNRRAAAAYQRAYDAARQKNEARFTEILGTPAGAPLRTQRRGRR